MSWLDGEMPNTYRKAVNEAGEPYFVHVASSINDKTSIGGFTYIHGSTRCVGNENIYIGKFCSIATDVTIHAGDEHNLQAISTFPFETVLGMKGFTYPEVTGTSVTIGNDVWIGEGATILSGSKIGSGAVIGAGCVIKGIVEPYSIMVGNPSVKKRYRCRLSVASFLLKLNWWDWSIAKIQRNKRFFSIPLEVLSEMSPQEMENLLVE